MPQYEGYEKGERHKTIDGERPKDERIMRVQCL